MPSLDSFESLQATLEPLEALRGEHSQLESWVNESFQALEKLHGELTVWQSDLARKQTDLDLREDALERCQGEEQDIEGKVSNWKQDLAQARSELEQLEEENTEQLQELGKLQRRQAILEAELKVATQRTEETCATLAAERAEAAQQQQAWQTEFSQMRRLLKKHCDMLSSHLGPTAPAEPEETTLDSDTTSRSAALRRRAKSRRAEKNRKYTENEDPSPS